MDAETIKMRAARVAAEFGGIWAPYQAFYIESILYTATRSLKAFDRYEDAIAADCSDAEIVDSLQEALTHAAGLSRFFWPPVSRSLPELAAARAARLKEAFAVADQSTLRGRGLRNALEHFEERLDRYLLGDPSGVILPWPVVGEVPVGPAEHAFRLVDPVSATFVIFGEMHAFAGVREEVNRIVQLATAMRVAGGHLPARSGDGEGG